MSLPMIIGWVMNWWGVGALLPAILIIFIPATVLFILVMFVFPKMWGIDTMTSAPSEQK
jgi:hypothetical protein